MGSLWALGSKCFGNVKYFIIIYCLHLICSYALYALESHFRVMATWSRSGINPLMMTRAEGMYLPQDIPVCVSGAQSLKTVCYYVHLPDNCLHLIPFPLMTQRTQVHHGVTHHCQRNFTYSFVLIPRKEVRILAN